MMTPREVWRQCGWLIVLTVLILLLLAVTEFLPAGQAGRVWVELINGIR